MARSDFCCICQMPIQLPAPRGEVVKPQDTDWCNYYRSLHISPQLSRMFCMSIIRYCPKARQTPRQYDLHAYIWNSLASGKKVSSNLCRCSAALDASFEAHTYCWDALERIFGGPLLDQKLKLLLIAFSTMAPWTPDEQHVGRNWSDSRLKWLGDRMYEEASTAKRTRLGENTIFSPVSDPGVPALKKLIERSTRNDDGTTVASSASRQQPRLEHGSHRPAAFRLPLELQLMVFDFLPDVVDVCSAVASFRWSVTDSYAMKRFPCHAVRELEHIPSEKLDWTEFFSGFAHIAWKYAWGLENRRRIHWIAKVIRTRYMGLQQMSQVL